MSVRGWVYVITNKAMPGLHKVGFSTKDPVLRAEELGHTGAPHPYAVIYDALVENARDVEQAVHRLLNDKREGKEWFRCSASEAIEAVQKSTTAILLERFSPEFGKASAQPSIEPEQLNTNVRCRYYGCKEKATHIHNETPYCYEHFRFVRNPKRSEAIERVRKELRDEWKKRQS